MLFGYSNDSSSTSDILIRDVFGSYCLPTENDVINYIVTISQISGVS
jgi:hypothetical protein